MSAPLRIHRPAGVSAPVAAPLVVPTAAGEEAAPVDDFNSYLERLTRMIPAPSISLYLVGSGLIPQDKPAVLAGWALVCLLGVVALLVYGTRDKTKGLPVDWKHTAISAAAFVIWVYSLGGPFDAYGLYLPYLGSLAVLAWTFFTPIFYKGPAE